MELNTEVWNRSVLRVRIMEWTRLLFFPSPPPHSAELRETSANLCVPHQLLTKRTKGIVAMVWSPGGAAMRLGMALREMALVAMSP